jgi:hypothetical protein
LAPPPFFQEKPPVKVPEQPPSDTSDVEDEPDVRRGLVVPTPGGKIPKAHYSDSEDFDRLSAEKQIYEKSKAVAAPEEPPIQPAPSSPSSISAEPKILSPSPPTSSPASMIFGPTSGEVSPHQIF